MLYFTKHFRELAGGFPHDSLEAMAGETTLTRWFLQK